MSNEQRLLETLENLVAQLQRQLPIPEQVAMKELVAAQELLEDLS